MHLKIIDRNKILLLVFPLRTHQVAPLSPNTWSINETSRSYQPLDPSTLPKRFITHAS